MEEYSSMCHRLMIFMDENGDEKWQWMNFFMNIRNKFYFAKKWTKEIGYKKFMLVYCDQFVTWNVQVILELVFHILAWSIQTIWNLRLHQIQRHINLLIPQRVCANSNSTCPPQRGMQPSETISSTLEHFTTLNSFLFSFVLSTPWQLAQWNCINFHSTTNLHAKYLNFQYSSMCLQS